MVSAKVVLTEAEQQQHPQEVQQAPQKPLDAWMDYQCYWVEGLETKICNFQGFIKHPTDIPLDFSLDKQQDLVNVQMLNTHDGGMVFGTCSPVTIGADIHIRVNLQGEELSLNGVVTHCIQLDEEHCDVGVQFKENNEHHSMRMIEQACHIEHYRKVWSSKGRLLSEDEAAQEWIQRFAASFPR